MKKIENYINGQITSVSDKDLPIYDPSTGEVISKVVLSNIDDFNNTIKSSKEAQLKWAEFTPLKRSKPLFLLE